MVKVIFFLPQLTDESLVGVHYEFVLGTNWDASKTIKIKTAGTDNNDTFILWSHLHGGNVEVDVAGDVITIPSSTPAGAYITCTAVTSNRDGSGNDDELWLVKAWSQTNRILNDVT